MSRLRPMTVTSSLIAYVRPEEKIFYLNLRRKRQMQNPPYSRVLGEKVRFAREPSRLDAGLELAEGVEKTGGGEGEGILAEHSAGRDVVVVALHRGARAKRETSRRRVFDHEPSERRNVVVVVLVDGESEVAGAVEVNGPSGIGPAQPH